MTTIDPRKVNLAEKDIEDWIFDNPRSIGVSKWVGRQVRVPSGIIDLLGVDDYRQPIVVEVKNVEITGDAILQVCRYASDIWMAVYCLQKDEPNAVYTAKPRKIVIGRGGISDKIQYEADAVAVELFTFDVELSLNIGGPWNWTTDKREEDQELLLNLAFTNDFHNTFAMPKPAQEEPPKE